MATDEKRRIFRNEWIKRVVHSSNKMYSLFLEANTLKEIKLTNEKLDGLKFAYEFRFLSNVF